MSVSAPLSGIRVLELGSSVAGPAATRLLADLGATVYKVEPPEGDQLRTWGELAPDGTSWWFKSHNRNKQLVVFDLHQTQDVAIVRKIALGCDAIVENFRPGWLAARGLGPSELRAQKPELIYVSISGYGQDGPYAERLGFGNVGEAVGGLRYLTGEADGPPTRMAISLGDELAGLYAAIAVLAALIARARDARGDTIDVSLVESCFSMLEGALPEYAGAKTIARRAGNRYMRAAPNSIYRTHDDQWIAIGGNAQAIFRRLATVIGQPQLAGDPRFATNQARIANAAELDRLIERWTRTLDARAAVKVLTEAGVPAGPVNSIADIASDPHFAARGSIASVPDDDGSPVATFGVIPRFAEHPARLERAAGAIGRDQSAVLHEFGLA